MLSNKLKGDNYRKQLCSFHSLFNNWCNVSYQLFLMHLIKGKLNSLNEMCSILPKGQLYRVKGYVFIEAQIHLSDDQLLKTFIDPKYLSRQRNHYKFHFVSWKCLRMNLFQNKKKGYLTKWHTINIILYNRAYNALLVFLFQDMLLPTTSNLVT